MTSYEVVQEDDTDVLFGNPFEGEDLEVGNDVATFSGISKGGDEGLKPMSLEYVCVSEIYIYKTRSQKNNDDL